MECFCDNLTRDVIYLAHFVMQLLWILYYWWTLWFNYSERYINGALCDALLLLFKANNSLKIVYNQFM